MKKILVFCIFLLFFSFFASARTLTGISIEAKVNENGNASVVEKYFFDFNGTNEVQEFRAKAAVNGNGLSAWNVTDAQIFLHLGEKNLVGDKVNVSFEEKGAEKFFKLSYSLNGLFIKKTGTDQIKLEINLDKLPFFYGNGLFVIPENFTLSFSFPSGSQIEEGTNPDAVVSETGVEWKGFASSSNPSLSFLIEKPFVPPPISSHEIEMNVSETGFAKITEKYFFVFADNDELSEFKRISVLNGSSPAVWKAYNKDIKTYIGSEEEVVSASVSFVEGPESPLTKSFIRISYELETPLFKKESIQTSRLVKWNLDPKKFSSFQAASAIVIPENTKIVFLIPVKAELIGTIKPDAVVEDHAITWRGYKSDNMISLSYVLEKNIAPAFDTAKFLKSLIQTRAILWILLVIAVIAVMVYWKRDKLNEKITGYLIKNSSITPKEETETDIEFE